MQKHRRNHVLHRVKMAAAVEKNSGAYSSSFSSEFEESFNVNIPSNFKYYHE